MTDRPTRPELPPGLNIEERVDDLGMGRRFWSVYVIVGQAQHLQRHFRSREEAVEWCWNFAPADPWVAFADAEMARANEKAERIADAMWDRGAEHDSVAMVHLRERDRTSANERFARAMECRKIANLIRLNELEEEKP